MPYSQLPKEKAEALEALERLVTRHKLVGEDEGRRIARVITEDPSFEFPPARAEPEAAAAAGGADGNEGGGSDEENEGDGRASSTS